jgi:BASS family bile acid:Na+ symporter
MYLQIANKSWIKLIYSPAIVFSIAIALGLIIGGFPTAHTAQISICALIFVMILSTTELQLSKLYELRAYSKELITMLVLNYVCLTSLIIILAYLLISDAIIRAGFIIMAAIPPAVAVVPFTRLLRGDIVLAIGALTLMYLLALGVTPTIVYIFLGATVNVLHILYVLIVLIILPLIISRLLVKINIDAKLGIWKTPMINLGFFVLIFAIVGANRTAFLTSPSILIFVTLICIIRTVVIGTAIYYITCWFNISFQCRVNYTLFGSYKNLGLTAIVALALFDERACIPAAICFLFEFIALVYYVRVISK